MKTLRPSPSQAEGKATLGFASQDSLDPKEGWGSMLTPVEVLCSEVGPGDNPHPLLTSKDKEFSWSYHKFISMCLQPLFLEDRFGKKILTLHLLFCQLRSEDNWIFLSLITLLR